MTGKDNSLLISITKGIKKSLPTGPERSVLNPFLSSTLPAKRMHELLHDTEMECDGVASELPEMSNKFLFFRRAEPQCEPDSSIYIIKQTVGLPGSFRQRYADPKMDLNEIMAAGSLIDKSYWRKKRDDNDIKLALNFILSSDNVQYLSWGTKLVVMPNGTKKDFPGLTRKRESEEMYRLYTHPSESNIVQTKPLGRSAFLKLVKLATKRQVHRKAAVDYVLGTLCYETMELLREIVIDFIDIKEERDTMLARISAVEVFLKFSFMEHVGRDRDGFHDVKNALGRESSLEKRAISCNDCCVSFSVMELLRKHPSIIDVRPDVVTAIKECQKKVLLFMAHQIRVSVQKKSIVEIQRMIQSDQSGCKALLLMDSKMKFDPIIYREKTVDFFGKRGLSWHGVLAFYGDVSGEMRYLYIDQIGANNSKQDRLVVVSMFDATLARIKRSLPHITEIFVLSDNARCYQNILLPVVIPFVTKAHGLLSKIFLHSETQDGKALVDAHFALAMMHVCRFVDQGNSVKTPSQLVKAINSNDGVANKIAEIVNVDRYHALLQAWESSKHICKIPRHNEVQYVENGDENSFTAKVYVMSEMETATYDLLPFISKLRRTTTAASNHSFLFGATSATANSNRDPVSRALNDHDDQYNDMFLCRESAGDAEGNNVIAIDFGGNIEEQDQPQQEDPTSHTTWFISVQTGVSITTDAHIRRFSRRAALCRTRTPRPQNHSIIDEAIEDEEDRAELGQHENASDSLDGMVGLSPALSSGQIAESIAEHITWSCNRCRRRFAHRNTLATHSKYCKGHVPTMLVERAKLFLSDIIESEDSHIYCSTACNPDFVSVGISACLQESLNRDQGWARRTFYGQSLGTNTVHLFRDEITAFTERGLADKSKKMAPSSMREELRGLYPHRYDLPSEQFITRLVTAHLQSVRKQTATTGDVDTITLRHSRISPVYTAGLKQLIILDDIEQCGINCNATPCKGCRHPAYAIGYSGSTR